MRTTTAAVAVARCWRPRCSPAAPSARAESSRRPTRARTPTPTPAAAAAQDAGGQARGEAAHGHLRLRHARHGLPDASRTTRTGSTSCGRRKLPSFADEFGADGHYFAGVRQSRLGVKGFIPTTLGEIKTIFEFELFGTGVDAGPDDVPPAPRLGRARPDRRGPDLEPVHGPRRLPELDRVLGPERHGVLPQRAAALDAVAEGRLELHDRARAAGRERRPGRLRGPHRAAGRQGPLPAARTSRRTTARRATGATSRWPASLREIKWDDLNNDQFNLSGQRDRLGRQRQLEPEAREARGAAAGRLRRGRRELHERRAGGHRHPEQPLEPGDAGRRQGAADPRHRGLPRPQLEREVDEHGRLLAGEHRQHRRPGRRRVQEGPVRARQRPLLPGRRTSSWARRSSGASARTSRTASRRTTSGSSSRSSTTSSYRWEASDDRDECSLPCPRSRSRLPRSRAP